MRTLPLLALVLALPLAAAADPVVVDVVHDGGMGCQDSWYHSSEEERDEEHARGSWTYGYEQPCEHGRTSASAQVAADGAPAAGASVSEDASGITRQESTWAYDARLVNGTEEGNITSNESMSSRSSTRTSATARVGDAEGNASDGCERASSGSSREEGQYVYQNDENGHAYDSRRDGVAESHATSGCATRAGAQGAGVYATDACEEHASATYVAQEHDSTSASSYRRVGTEEGTRSCEEGQGGEVGGTSAGRFATSDCARVTSFDQEHDGSYPPTADDEERETCRDVQGVEAGGTRVMLVTLSDTTRACTWDACSESTSASRSLVVESDALGRHEVPLL